jgi:hypothetical protein
MAEVDGSTAKVRVTDLLQAIEKNFHRPEKKNSAKQSADCPAIPTLLGSRLIWL